MIARTGSTCVINGCERPKLAKGFCNTHYRRMKRYGDPEKTVITHSWSGIECSTDGCDRNAKIKGLCSMHYQRQKNSGTTSPRPKETPDEKFGRRTAEGPAPVHRPDLGSCLEWQGGTNNHGYGQMTVDGKSVYVHRWSYWRHVGPIPEGMVIDHLCRNPKCARPAHLEVVTQGVNMQRSTKARLSAEQAEEIRRIFVPGAAGNLSALAERFGVAKHTIQSVVAGRSFRTPKLVRTGSQFAQHP